MVPQVVATSLVRETGDVREPVHALGAGQRLRHDEQARPLRGVPRNGYIHYSHISYITCSYMTCIRSFALTLMFTSSNALRCLFMTSCVRCSDAVRLRDAVRRRLPTGAALCTPQQHHRDPSRRLQVRLHLAEAARCQSRWHRHLDANHAGHQLHRRAHKCKSTATSQSCRASASSPCSPM